MGNLCLLVFSTIIKGPQSSYQTINHFIGNHQRAPKVKFPRLPVQFAYILLPPKDRRINHSLRSYHVACLDSWLCCQNSAPGRSSTSSSRSSAVSVHPVLFPKLCPSTGQLLPPEIIINFGHRPRYRSTRTQGRTPYRSVRSIKTPNMLLSVSSDTNLQVSIVWSGFAAVKPKCPPDRSDWSEVVPGSGFV